MKTISIFAQGLSGGGAERVASIIANELSKRGYKVHYVAAFSSKKEYYLSPQIEYHFIGQFNGAGKISRIIRQLLVLFHMRKTKSDVALSFIITDQDYAFNSRKYKKIVSLRNDPQALMKSPYLNRMIPKVFSKADYVVFQTEDAKKYFEPKIQKKGCVIQNPISSNLPSWNEEKHKRIIMTACRLEKQKNIPLLIEAFSDFVVSHPDYILNIFGEGSLFEILSEMIDEKNLNDKVFLKGQTKTIYKEYCESEMFVLPSDYEGMSNSMLEALSIGIPTICTDCPVGGARALITNMENGILTTVGNKEELLKAMGIVADNYELREKFSSNSQLLKNKLSIEKVVDEWENLF